MSFSRNQRLTAVFGITFVGVDVVGNKCLVFGLTMSAFDKTDETEMDFPSAPSVIRMPSARCGMAWDNFIFATCASPYAAMTAFWCAVGSRSARITRIDPVSPGADQSRA